MIRQAALDDAGAIARVHVTAWRETYDGLMPRALLASQTVEDRETFWRSVLAGGTRLLVAEQDHAVVGFAFAGPARQDMFEKAYGASEIYALNLVNRAKRQGFGRALFAAVLDTLDPDVPLGLWVLTANTPACAFYDKMGGRPEAERAEEVHGAMLRETGYYWRRTGDARNAALRTAR